MLLHAFKLQDMCYWLLLAKKYIMEIQRAVFASVLYGNTFHSTKMIRPQINSDCNYVQKQVNGIGMDIKQDN